MGVVTGAPGGCQEIMVWSLDRIGRAPPEPGCVVEEAGQVPPSCRRMTRAYSVRIASMGDVGTSREAMKVLGEHTDDGEHRRVDADGAPEERGIRRPPAAPERVRDQGHRRRDSVLHIHEDATPYHGHAEEREVARRDQLAANELRVGVSGKGQRRVGVVRDALETLLGFSEHLPASTIPNVVGSAPTPRANVAATPRESAGERRSERNVMSPTVVRRSARSRASRPWA